MDSNPEIGGVGHGAVKLRRERKFFGGHNCTFPEKGSTKGKRRYKGKRSSELLNQQSAEEWSMERPHFPF